MARSAGLQRLAKRLSLQYFLPLEVPRCRGTRPSLLGV